MINSYSSNRSSNSNNDNYYCYYRHTNNSLNGSIVVAMIRLAVVLGRPRGTLRADRRGAPARSGSGIGTLARKLVAIPLESLANKVHCDIVYYRL